LNSFLAASCPQVADKASIPPDQLRFIFDRKFEAGMHRPRELMDRCRVEELVEGSQRSLACADQVSDSLMVISRACGVAPLVIRCRAR
jgi:hypothetical protein